MKKVGNKKGFSLLELLVVLLFMALMASMLFPQLVKTREASNFNTEKLRFIYAIQSLPFFCLNNGIEANIDAFPIHQEAIQEVLKLPLNWEVEVLSPIVINNNGFCEGGQLKVEVNNRKFLFDILPPLCESEVVLLE